jgi:hypothetical protein
MGVPGLLTARAFGGGVGRQGRGIKPWNTGREREYVASASLLISACEGATGGGSNKVGVQSVPVQRLLGCGLAH